MANTTNFSFVKVPSTSPDFETAATSVCGALHNALDAIDAAAFLDQAVQVISAPTGTINIKQGTVYLTKSDAAGLYVLPVAIATTDDGKVLRIMSTAAKAHVISSPTTASTMFNGTTDTCTFTAVISNNIVVQAYNGNWYVQATVNGTLSSNHKLQTVAENMGGKLADAIATTVA